MYTTIKCLILCLFAITVNSLCEANEFAVNPSAESQQAPDIDGSMVVWQQNTTANGWNIYGRDLNDTSTSDPIAIAQFPYDQTHPVIWSSRVIWQDNNTTNGDWNIKMADISDPDVPQYYILDGSDGDQTSPAIHGDLAVWQDDYYENDTDLYAADIADPDYPYVFALDTTISSNQAAPAVFRNTVVYQDDYYGDWDITLADAWLKNEPAYEFPAYEYDDETAPAIDRDYIIYQLDYSGDGTDYDILAVDYSDPRVFVTLPISQLPSSEKNPDISAHIVVWQDDRNDNWDIYGYNLITQKEFQITNDPADQTNPAISGDTVVWEDMRSGTSVIWAVYLDPVDMADCPMPLEGDTDGNCRVDLVDFVQLAQNWLDCDLDPADACIN